MVPDFVLNLVGSTLAASASLLFKALDVFVLNGLEAVVSTAAFLIKAVLSIGGGINALGIFDGTTLLAHANGANFNLRSVVVLNSDLLNAFKVAASLGLAAAPEVTTSNHALGEVDTAVEDAGCDASSIFDLGSLYLRSVLVLNGNKLYAVEVAASLGLATAPEVTTGNHALGEFDTAVEHACGNASFLSHNN